MAQLVAHLHGMQGVTGSNPVSSTQKVRPFIPPDEPSFYFRVLDSLKNHQTYNYSKVMQYSHHVKVRRPGEKYGIHTQRHIIDYFGNYPLGMLESWSKSQR